MDRRFLEGVTSRMIELNRSYPSGVFEAKGNYSDFLERGMPRSTRKPTMKRH